MTIKLKKKVKIANTNNFKSKNDLVKNVIEQSNDLTKLIRKVIRQVKSAKTAQDKQRLKINWNDLESGLKTMIKQWQIRQTKKIIDQFLEEIKLSLKQKKNVTFHNYFSLKVYRSAKRKVRNPQTGGLVTVKEQNRISFRASPNLRKEIN